MPQLIQIFWLKYDQQKDLFRFVQWLCRLHTVSVSLLCFEWVIDSSTHVKSLRWKKYILSLIHRLFLQFTCSRQHLCVISDSIDWVVHDRIKPYYPFIEFACPQMYFWDIVSISPAKRLIRFIHSFTDSFCSLHAVVMVTRWQQVSHLCAMSDSLIHWLNPSWQNHVLLLYFY